MALRNDVIWEFGSEDPSFTQLYSTLGTALTGSPFLPGLCNESGVASRILWPTEHLDAPLREQTPTPASRHSWSVVARKLLADHGYAT